MVSCRVVLCAAIGAFMLLAACALQLCTNWILNNADAQLKSLQNGLQQARDETCILQASSDAPRCNIDDACKEHSWETRNGHRRKICSDWEKALFCQCPAHVHYEGFFEGVAAAEVDVGLDFNTSRDPREWCASSLASPWGNINVSAPSARSSWSCGPEIIGENTRLRLQLDCLLDLVPNRELACSVGYDGQVRLGSTDKLRTQAQDAEGVLRYATKIVGIVHLVLFVVGSCACLSACACWRNSADASSCETLETEPRDVYSELA
eukprot:TRINITY_DN64237_c0_g1_i1.p1 TRINITY_DN64237_c0_g1~~TRINITY_DN64237_c0_g1_i1.p1  ORF type:complete len:280 (+),score=44.46 TRINITY_DN64237_c0_g1_i1:47-841(+)